MTQISQSRSRSSADDASLKICIVIESNLNNRYEVFLVDFDEPPKSSSCLDLGLPFFRVPLDYPSFASFFAFGSRIYFLGGSRPTPSRVNVEFSKDVYMWDTSSHNPTFELVCCMNNAKIHPLVFGPFKGKFYLLGHDLSALDFEEFDPKSNSCKLLPEPPIDDQYHACGNGTNPIIYPAYFVNRHVVVNKGSKILISTMVLREDQLGVYSYDIPNNEWCFDKDKRIPFEHAISIDKDNDFYFAYAELKGGFCTCRYNDGNWFDFREVQDDSPLYDPYFCVSLGDGRAWAIKSEYDKDVFLTTYGPEPMTHYIKLGRFKAEDVPADIHSLGDHSYEEAPYDGRCFRMVRNSFPFCLYNTADAVDPGTSRSKKKNKNRNKNLEKQVASVNRISKLNLEVAKPVKNETADAEQSVNLTVLMI